MPRGRPPKPTALKLLTGNPGKRPLNGSEPQPLATPPVCPDFLPADAKAKWAELAPELSRLGLLTVVDGEALACLCSAWADFKAATETIAKEGRYQLVGGWPVEVKGDDGEVRTEVRGGQLQPHPALAQHARAMKAIKEFAALFGLEPSSRSRLHVRPAAPLDSASGKSGVGARKRG
jgi:P27 family predicted phage terminase small subunit